MDENDPKIGVKVWFMMLIKRGVSLMFRALLCCGLLGQSSFLCGSTLATPTTMTYHISVADFIQSFIAIPTSTGGGSTIEASYLAGRAPVYDVNNMPVGTCSASFLSMETADGIFTDISNYLSLVNGLIVTWFTPTRLINLEADSIVNSMVTECTVVVTTKIGFSPFFGQTFNLIVSSDGQNIYFQFTRIGTIF